MMTRTIERQLTQGRRAVRQDREDVPLTAEHDETGLTGEDRLRSHPRDQDDDGREDRRDDAEAAGALP